MANTDTATQQETALRKRQQIAKANRTMFLWVAAISAIVGIALVVSGFLFQKALFNEKVLAVKSKTASTLVANNKAVGELKNQIRVLNTNQALKDSMIGGETDPVQVVLDALPSEANSAALGSSLQQKFLLSDPALTIQSFVVDPVPGVESDSSDVAATSSADASMPAAPGGAGEITFSFAVTATDANALKSLLQRLEKSIRAIDLTSVSVESQGANLELTVSGRAFYQPAKTVQLKNETVKP